MPANVTVRCHMLPYSRLNHWIVNKLKRKPIEIINLIEVNRGVNNLFFFFFLFRQNRKQNSRH